jgi:hypothetical protein
LLLEVTFFGIPLNPVTYSNFICSSHARDMANVMQDVNVKLGKNIKNENRIQNFYIKDHNDGLRIVVFATLRN